MRHTTTFNHFETIHGVNQLCFTFAVGKGRTPPYYQLCENELYNYHLSKNMRNFRSIKSLMQNISSLFILWILSISNCNIYKHKMNVDNIDRIKIKCDIYYFEIISLLLNTKTVGALIKSYNDNYNGNNKAAITALNLGLGHSGITVILPNGFQLLFTKNALRSNTNAINQNDNHKAATTNIRLKCDKYFDINWYAKSPYLDLEYTKERLSTLLRPLTQVHHNPSKSVIRNALCWNLVFKQYGKIEIENESFFGCENPRSRSIEKCNVSFDWMKKIANDSNNNIILSTYQMYFARAACVCSNKLPSPTKNDTRRLCFELLRWSVLVLCLCILYS